MKRIAAAAVGVLAALLVASPALATEDPIVNTVHVISTPDDGDPAWARDTFDRTTTITGSGEDWLVEIVDEGTFTTGDVTGVFSGHATWLATGGSPNADIPATFDAIDRSGEATKGDFTSQWWTRFFGEGSTSTGIEGWEWTYSRCSGDAKVTRTENESGVNDVTYADLKSAVCPKATPSATPSATAAPTNPATGEPTGAAAAGGEGPSLPVTGAGVTTIAVVGVALVAAGVLLVARRRRRFEA